MYCNILSDHDCNICIFRAIDFQALLGTVGGYIGLILGYTVLQIPDFLVTVFGRMKRSRYLNRFIDPNRNVVSTFPHTMSTSLANQIELEPKYKMDKIDDLIHLKIRKALEAYDEKLNSKLNNAIAEINTKIGKLSRDLKD